MPRRGAGSKAPYGNRQDLNLPTTTVPNQEYGDAAQQAAAQNAIPMASAPQGTPAAAAPAPAAAAPAPIPSPGSMPLLGPSQRPEEPVTHGLPMGEGAGPEVLGPVAQDGRAAVQAELERLASGPYSTPELMQLASFARGA